MTGITTSGIGSGLDIAGLVQQLVAVERQPTEIRLARQEAQVQAKISAYGSLKSALSAFNAELDKLKEADSLLLRKADSSDEELVTVSVDGAAVPSAYEVEVLQLAQSQKLESGAFGSPDDVVGTGTLTIGVGADAFTVEIDSENNTLAAIRNAINGAVSNTGVQATIVNADGGSYLILTAEQTGADKSITVTQAGGDGGLSALEYDPPNGLNSLTETRQALDAQVNIDGLLVTNDSNTISGAIEGATLNLIAAAPGTTASVNVENDTGAVKSRIEAFVEKYNDMIDVFNELTAYNVETRVAGPLLGDSTIRGVSSLLRRELGVGVDDIEASFSSLLDIGIESDVDGKLSIDSDVLDGVIESEFTKLGQLFANSDGYAIRLSSAVDEYLDGTDGIIQARLDGLDESIDVFNEQRERLEIRLESFEARLQRQFIALDTLVGELTNTSNFLAQQLQSLPGITAPGD